MVHDPWGEVLSEARGLRDRATATHGLPAIDAPFVAPPAGHGDVGFPCFAAAKAARRPPQDVARDVAAAMPRGRLLVRHEAAQGYVNSFLDPAAFATLTLDTVHALGAGYGNHPPKGVRVLVEHTSVNPTGPIHVGRARNPVIGDALARILRRAGYDVLTEYLVNDVGRQMVLMTWGVDHLRPEELPPEGRAKEDHNLVRYYQAATSHAEKNPAVERDVDDLIRRLEGGEPEIAAKVRAVAERVLAGIVDSLARIDVRFDRFFWESDALLDGSVRGVVDRLRPKAQEEDGAYFIDLAPFGVQGEDTRYFLVRKDGTTLYPTRDIAYHLNKFARCDVALNVLGEDQKLAQQQLAAALRLLDVGRAPEPLFYAYVSLPEGRMSTRKGVVVTLDDLVDEAVDRAYEEVAKRRDDLDEARKRAIAELVGVSAVRYHIGRVQAEKRIVFRWEEALALEGNSAPFLQYAHARACGILDKAGGWKPPADAGLLGHSSELDLVRQIAQFPSTVEDAARQRAVHVVAAYAYELAVLFNRFYRDCPVLQAEEPLRSARLSLVDAARLTLAHALDCLGVKAPAEM